MLAALLPAGFFALAWQERSRRLAREARAFMRFLVDHDLRTRLIARRRALADELTALAEESRREAASTLAASSPPRPDARGSAGAPRSSRLDHP